MKTLILILAASVAVVAQTTPCSLTTAQSPTLRGFRLGFSVEDVKSRTDMWGISLGKKPDETGFVEALIMPSQLLNTKDQENLSSVQLGFLDGHIVTIEVRYNDSVKWNSLEEFTSAVTQALKLPSAWQTQLIEASGSPISAQTLRCGEIGFAAVYLVDRPVLIMHRTDTKQIRDQRRAELQERTRRNFKP